MTNQKTPTDNGLLRVTLDFNCLIDLEEKRPGHDAVGKIIQLHNEKRLQLIIPGISASERKKGTDGPAHFFQEFLALLDRNSIPQECIVYPFARYGMTYIGASFYAPSNPVHKILEWEVHQILHPQVQHNYQAHCKVTGYSGKKVDSKWLNKICDTETMWCHLTSKSDLFVSSDENFHKQTKLPKLIALGACCIARPVEALALIESGLSREPNCRRVELIKYENGQVAHVPSSYENYTKYHQLLQMAGTTTGG